MRVLVAEDDEVSRIVLDAMLEGQGYDVLSTSNGKEALERVRESPPDLIISDILMPEMDGFDLCWNIKNDPDLTHIPIIFYTATYGSELDKKLGLLMGASRYIIKPQEPEVLSRLIKEVLNEYDEKGPTIPLQTSEFRTMINRMHLEAKERKLQQKTTKLENIKIQKQELNEQLIQLATDLQAMNQSCSDFSFAASHHLIEPLRKMSCFSAMIKEVYGDSLDEQQQEYLRAIEQASLEMKRYIGDIGNSI